MRVKAHKEPYLNQSLGLLICEKVRGNVILNIMTLSNPRVSLQQGRHTLDHGQGILKPAEHM